LTLKQLFIGSITIMANPVERRCGYLREFDLNGLPTQKLAYDRQMDKMW